MALRQLLHLRPGATFDAEGRALTLNLARVVLRDAAPATLEALGLLAGDGLDADRLPLDPALGMFCTRLESAGWLSRTLLADDQLLLTREPEAFVDVLTRQGLLPDVPVRRSRFGVLHDDDGKWVLSSGVAHARAVLHDPRVAALLSRLSDPVLPASLENTGLAADELEGVLRTLLQARLLVRLDDAADPERDEQPAGQWHPVDLLFHASSRLGRRAGGYGGTYPHRGRFAEPPARRPPGPGPRVRLPVPDLDAVAAADPPLTTVLERRRSIRRHDDAAPLDLPALAELLYRTSRVRRVLHPDGFGEFTLKPYPSGGALYELDVYPVVRRCEGLDPGVYRYDGEAHELELVGSDEALRSGLLDQARVSALMDEQPQVLLTVAARFPRVSWKYEGMPYSLILKHVGVLYQTVYLVATAMDLAVCGLGGGDADLFACAAGLDYLAETSVGEMVVGSRHPDDTGPGVAEVARPTRSF